MSWSVKLFTVRGIPIRVHASFLLILAWAAYMGFTDNSRDWLRGVAFMMALVLLLFVCVVLHELGHSLVAQLFGVRVEDITLWPVGGVARMARMPERPYQEFLISAAGPATNILLAICLGVVAIAWITPARAVQILSAPWLLSDLVGNMNGRALLLLLTANNALLALFNLIPAFPMDGGRLLRSMLAAVVPFGRATGIAAGVGQVVAVLMGLGALMGGNFLLVLVSVFVFVAAWQERQQAVFEVNLRGVLVRQVMQPLGRRLNSQQSLAEASAETAAQPHAGYLVVDEGRLAGVLSRHVLLSALRGTGATARVADYMRRDYLQLRPDDALEAIQERLAQERDRLAVVVEQGRVIGTLSQADLVRVAQVLAAHPAALTRD